ncbi:MAG: hypothetical protein V3V97_03815 [Hyphomicrobiaceae bacterium]
MARLELTAVEGATCGGLSTSPDALFELGLMYSSGRDVDPDLIAAHKWFNLAALRGNKQAREYRSEISQEMSRREIAKAQRLAREWLAKY